MMKKNVFIIILNYKRKDLTISCIKSLQNNLSKYNIEIIIVDNNSNDGSAESFVKLLKGTKLIVNSKNLGWSGGNNVGIKYALKNHADAVLLLNNDTIIEKNCIDHIIEKLFLEKEIGIVSPKVYEFGKKKVIANAGSFMRTHRYFGYEKGSGEIDKGQYDRIRKTDYVAGTAMMIKKEVFEKTGILDENYFLYYEDVDLCYRAKKKGFHCTFVQNAIVYHRNAATAKLNSPLHHYYNTRNHYLFVEKHAPIIVKLREFLRTPKTIWEFAVSKDKIKKKYSLLGIRDYYLRKFGRQTYW